MDDLDEFLYGDEAPVDNTAATASPPQSADVVGDGDGQAVTTPAAPVDPTRDRDSDNDGEEDDDDSSDDDNVEIVLDGDADDDDLLGAAGVLGSKPGETRTAAMQLKPTQQTGDDNQQKAAGGQGGVEEMDEVIPLRGGVNINGIGEYNGQSILDHDLDAGDEKMWRKPGADITDFFNYGFSENTWRAYCMKQKQMREEMGVISKRGYNVVDDRLRDRRDEPPPRGDRDHGRSGYRGGRGGDYDDALGRPSRGGRDYDRGRDFDRDGGRDYDRGRGDGGREAGRDGAYGQSRPPRDYGGDRRDHDRHDDRPPSSAAGSYEHERRDKRRRDSSVDSLGRDRRSRELR